jgi:hypothetical protein
MRSRLSSFCSQVFAGFLLLLVTGCGAIIIPFGPPGTPVTSYGSLTGDWVFQATPTSGSAPFASMAGYIDQAQASNGTSSSTAAFQLQSPSSCYLGATLVPWYGDVETTTFNLNSFDVNAQFITVTGTKNSTGTTLTGTYSIAGGCANGAAGTITGTRYAPMNGTYSGTGTPGAVQLTLAESATGTGSGTFLITGTATFGGISCFSSGTLSGTSGSILGNAAILDFTTNEAAQSQLVLTGTIDPLASTFTVSSMQVTGGNCSGNLGTATLQHQ